MFVEGPIEEKFLLSIESEIKQKTGYKKISVISLMSGFFSKPLIDNLHKLSNDYAFIVEHDEDGRFMDRIKSNLDGKCYLLIENIINYLRLENLMTDEQWGERLTSLKEKDDLNYKRNLRRHFFARLIRREGALEDIVAKYLDQGKAEAFLSELNDNLKKYFT